MEWASEKLGPVRTSSIPVLVVDDNIVNQKVVLALLERLGESAVTVINGREAVEAIGRERFSAILMDCHMPEMDGFEATIAIRKFEELTGSYTPIIAVTALTMAGDRERCIAAGMDDYIPKPINKELLKIKLTYWLRKEVVYRNQKYARKYLHAHAGIAHIKDVPLNLPELEEFYGEQQLDQILDIFIANSEELLRRIVGYIREKNGQSVAGLAHELKASSASIGAKQLAKLSLYLEQSAVQQDWIEATEISAALIKSFQHLKDYLPARSKI
jgi:CheY-like chemotaxis protein